MLARRSITFVLLSVACAAWAQAPFPDVPDDHWAREAVVRLADLGILVGFPDGTFRGDRTITRYEAALVVDRLLTLVSDDALAIATVLEDEVAVLRRSVGALADALAELRAAARADRAALEGIWNELAEIRESLGLPPPAPLPPPPAIDAPMPEVERDAPDTGPVGTGVRTTPADDAASGERGIAVPERPAADGAPSARERPSTDETPADLDDAPTRTAPEDRTTPTTPGGVEALHEEPGTRAHVDVAVGTAGGSRVLLRAGVGLSDIPADRFGLRIALDLGGRSEAHFGSVALMGHATYRILEAPPWSAYGGFGAGVEMTGASPFVGVVAGATWAASDPVALFAEATIDAYLLPRAPGAPTLAPALALGARWRF